MWIQSSNVGSIGLEDHLDCPGTLMNSRRAFVLSLAAFSAAPTAVWAGTWGHQSFENDGALDWIGEFLEHPAVVTVQRALSQATTGKYLDSDVGEHAIAAAEVVAASLGRPAKGLSPKMKPFVSKHRKELQTLAPLARSAMKAVRGPRSELRERWSLHADDLATWEGAVDSLVSRLSASAI